MGDSEKTSDSMLSEDAVAESGKAAQDCETDQGTPALNTITAVEEPAADSQDGESSENLTEEKKDDVMEAVNDKELSTGVAGGSLDVDMAEVTGIDSHNDNINIEELLDLPATDVEGAKQDEVPTETVSISESSVSDQFMSQSDAMVIQSEPPQQLMEEAEDGQSCEGMLESETVDKTKGTTPNAEVETANDLLISLLEDKPTDDAGSSSVVEKDANEEQIEPNTAELGAVGHGIDLHLTPNQAQEVGDHFEDQLMQDASELPDDIHDPEVLPAAVMQGTEESLADGAADKELPTDNSQDTEELPVDGRQEEETDNIQGTVELPPEPQETEERSTEGKEELPSETLLDTGDAPADGTIDSDALPSEQAMDILQDLPADSKEEDTTEAMELPVGESGAETEATENFAILAGGDHIEGSLGDLEGKILVGPDGSLHLMSGQESLQGMQLMEGDDRPEDEAEAALQGEAAQRELQDQLQAALLQEQAAILKEEEMKQEAQEEAKEKEADEPPEGQSSAESDALATLASAALDLQAPPNGVKSETIKALKKEREEPQWMDVGICKGTHCTVRTFYIPSETQSWDKNWDHVTTSTLPDHRALAKLELEAGKAYKFRVAAINSCGRSEWSEYSAFRTSMPGVPGAPSNIKISKTVDGAHLSWEPPSNAAGAIEDYTVYMAVRNVTTNSSQVVSSGATQLAFVRIHQGVDNQCSVSNDTLTEAHIDTTTKPAILFRIAARNEKGLGPAIQVRWLQDVGAANTRAGVAARRPGPEMIPHANIKRLKSECE